MDNYYLGIDVGSVSINIVLIDEFKNLYDKKYLRTRGEPIEVIKTGLRYFKNKHANINIKGVGTTGSGRNLAGVMVGADTVKNEITAHAVAAAEITSDVKTVLEIGGQDSKIIIIRDGIAIDFGMNTVCAAGTGSFLDHQAMRLGIPIEEFGSIALQADNSVRIAGRCAVFAESDMIHKQQMGHDVPEIIAGLCDALVRNYLNNVGKGKDIQAPIVFQGGVAANEGIRRSFKNELNTGIIVPENYDVMGAIGAGILAREKMQEEKRDTYFKGFDITDFDYRAESYECDGCSNHCEIINIYQNGKLIARWGGKCRRGELKTVSR